MFSVVGTTPTTRIGALSSAMARMAQTTAAPPAMSSFIRSMPSAGLIEMPPVSKVMPLPTRPRTGDSGAPGGSWRRTMTRGGSALPRATPSSSPIPSLLDLLLVEDLDADARLPAIAAARSANTRGVSTLDGSFANPRARLLDSPRIWPRSTAASSAGVPATPAAARRWSAPSAAGRSARPSCTGPR